MDIFRCRLLLLFFTPEVAFSPPTHETSLTHSDCHRRLHNWESWNCTHIFRFETYTHLESVGVSFFRSNSFFTKRVVCGIWWLAGFFFFFVVFFIFSVLNDCVGKQNRQISIYNFHVELKFSWCVCVHSLSCTPPQAIIIIPLNKQIYTVRKKISQKKKQRSNNHVWWRMKNPCTSAHLFDWKYIPLSFIYFSLSRFYICFLYFVRFLHCFTVKFPKMDLFWNWMPTNPCTLREKKNMNESIK